MSSSEIQQQPPLEFGDVLWHGIRCATGYTLDEFIELPHKTLKELKPALESLDLVDVTWTDRTTLQQLRDDLDTRLQHRRTYLEEKTKRANRKFTSRNYIEDKKFEAIQQRDRDSSMSPTDILSRFKRIDFTSRGIKITDLESMQYLWRVNEIILSDNDIKVVTSLPPSATLAILSSNEIHRIQLHNTSHHHKTLMALSVAGNCISSLNFLDQFPNLSALDCSYNCISSLDAGVACNQVLEHRHLTELNLVGNPITLSPDFRQKAEIALRRSKSIKTLDGISIHSLKSKNIVSVSASSSEQQQQQQASSLLAMKFQVLGIKGFNELTSKYFNLQSTCQKVLQMFYSPQIVDTMTFQASITQPTQGGGGGSKSSKSAAAQQQAAAALSLAQQQGHEQSLLNWANQVTTSLKTQALWMDTEKALCLDDMMQLSPTVIAEYLQQQQQQLLSENESNNKNINANANNEDNSNITSSQQQQNAQTSSKQSKAKSSTGSKHRGAASGGGTSSNAAAAAKIELAQQQKEQQTHQAMSSAATEFLLPSLRTRPTISREIMLPLRLGLVFTVTNAPGLLVSSPTSTSSPHTTSAANSMNPTANASSSVSTKEGSSNNKEQEQQDQKDNSNNNNEENKDQSSSELPVATIGWASLSPSDVVGGNPAVVVSSRVGVDRATLLTAKERVAKLTQQLITIRTSLEKEIQENAWRRDTLEFSIANANASGDRNPMGKSHRGGAHRAGGGRSKNFGADNSGFGGSGSPTSPQAGGGSHHGGPPSHASGVAADPNVDAFFQSQIAGRKRGEETYKQLALEMAILGIMEGLEQTQGHVQVDAKFILCRASSCIAGGGVGSEEKSSREGSNNSTTTNEGSGGNNNNAVNEKEEQEGTSSNKKNTGANKQVTSKKKR